MSEFKLRQKSHFWFGFSHMNLDCELSNCITKSSIMTNWFAQNWPGNGCYPMGMRIFYSSFLNSYLGNHKLIVTHRSFSSKLSILRLVVMHCVMRFTMGLEFLFPVECFWTEVTFEPGFSRVYPHVGFHVALLVEPFGAIVTLKRFFTGVS